MEPVAIFMLVGVVIIVAILAVASIGGGQGRIHRIPVGMSNPPSNLFGPENPNPHPKCSPPKVQTRPYDTRIESE